MSSNSGHGDVVEFARALEEVGPLLVGWLESPISPQSSGSFHGRMIITNLGY